MSITFRCEHCHKNVQAPDSAGGRRGKCPYCDQSSYIPAPVSEDELVPLAPIDEAEERQRAEKIKELMESEHDLIAETGGEAEASAEQMENPTTADLYHFVVNYVLDMAGGRLEQAEVNAKKLIKFGPIGTHAVEDFMTDKAVEPTLDYIPKNVRKGFLKDLYKRLK